jgi:hypothetical protein
MAAEPATEEALWTCPGCGWADDHTPGCLLADDEDELVDLNDTADWEVAP